MPNTFSLAESAIRSLALTRAAGVSTDEFRHLSIEFGTLLPE